MIRLIFIPFLLMILMACIGESTMQEIEKPSNLLPKKEFIDLLTEVTIIEATHQMRYIQVSRYSTILQNECDSMFKAKNSSGEAFEASMKYYSLKPLEMKEMYEEVSKEIEKRKSELVIEPEVVETANQDSITTISNGIKGRSKIAPTE